MACTVSSRFYTAQKTHLPALSRALSFSAPILRLKRTSSTPVPVAEPIEENELTETTTTENWRPILSPTPEDWRKHRDSMKKSFPGGWDPPRKLSRDAMESLRDLHARNPATFTTSVLADRFMISPEAARRILRGKWLPSNTRRQQLLDREARLRDEAIRRQRDREKAQLDEIEGEMVSYAAKTTTSLRQDLPLDLRPMTNKTLGQA